MVTRWSDVYLYVKKAHILRLIHSATQSEIFTFAMHIEDFFGFCGPV